MFSGPREVGALAIQRIKALQRYGVDVSVEILVREFEKNGFEFSEDFYFGLPEDNDISAVIPCRDAGLRPQHTPSP